MLPLFLTLLAGLPAAMGFWRMPCKPFKGTYRIDPILVNGAALSPHAHSIAGSTGFGFDTKYSDLRNSCSTCGVEADKSAYWIPSLVFRHANGTYETVESIGEFLAYYLQFPVGQKVTSFPPGFQMISGNSNRRTFDGPIPDPPKSLWTDADLSQDALMEKAIGYNCLNYGAPPEPSLFRHSLPDKAFIDGCRDGVRLEIAFPSCSNGGSFNKADPMAHVAYSSLVLDGTCPEDYPIRFPTIFLEVIMATQDFIGKDGQFMLSNGDTTGNGLHADYMMGWDQGVLQQALDTCRDGSGMIEACPAFQVDYAQYSTCQYNPPKIAAVENCADPRSQLCGAGGPPASPLVAPAAANKPEPNIKLSNYKVVYETITMEEFTTTTMWEKRSLPTDPPQHQGLKKRSGYQHHQHHHNAHANGR